MENDIGRMVQAARERDIQRSLQEAAPDLYAALEALMAIVDTPSGRNSLDLDPDSIELVTAQKALTKARKYFQPPGDCPAFRSLLKFSNS